jgi:heme-degrading monooxygenase HmoA
MFANMAFVTSVKGKEKEMLEVMTAFKNSLLGSPGLLQIHVMKELEGGDLLGISMWENKESFDIAMDKMEPDPASAAKARVTREAPPIVRQFVEINVSP